MAGREVGTRYGEGCLRERKKERKGDTAGQSEGNGRVQHNDQTRGLKWVVCRCADMYPPRLWLPRRRSTVYYRLAASLPSPGGAASTACLSGRRRRRRCDTEPAA